LGSPRTSGNSGAASHTSGGATIINNKCWIMCACSSSGAKVSIGDASARKIASNPPTKASHRPTLQRPGSLARSASQPRV
jgi:hypothetical protein